MDKELAAKVKAVNRANAMAAALFQQVKRLAAPFVGEQVIKKDGTLMQRFAKVLPEFPRTPNMSVHKLSSCYSLAWVVKACEHVEDASHVTYYERTFYVGNLKGGVLVSLYDNFEGKSDYNAEEIERLRGVCTEARKKYEEARDALFPFGE